MDSARLDGQRGGKTRSIKIGRRGELHRHHDRVVRLLPVRHGSRTGVRRSVLPGRRAADRHAAGVEHVRGGLRRPAARRRRVRALRRPRRPQVDARHVAADHGHRDVPDRLPADAQLDRHPGADPARDAALRAGHRRRRRVGRRGADVGRARPEGPPRLLRLVAADGRSGRPADLDAGVQARAEPDMPRRRSRARAGASRSWPARSS